MSELKEDFVLVQDPGDPSVGIQPSTFETKGPLFFTDREEKEDFRKALQEAFEYVTDQPHVVFQTEYDAECQAEEQFEREIDEADHLLFDDGRLEVYTPEEFIGKVYISRK